MNEARLEELLREAAADASGAEESKAGGGTIWALGGRPFAALSAGTAEFHLDATVGAAARRTPGTATSPRGEAWVAFRPQELDQYAEDRLRAWFAAAHRRATA